ncbi:hypothetical protein [Streptomyces sp. NPDC053048]|uniref:hypothetical protein n=1 Tax=Streptomyces sp. NPDC053048 TaxID=3365694 RepID=UPI0037D3AAB0
MANKGDRTTFLKRFGEVLGDATTAEQVAAAYELVKTEGRSLGRSVNWQSACDWLIANYEEAADDARRHWVILEGSMMMTYANA